MIDNFNFFRNDLLRMRRKICKLGSRRNSSLYEYIYILIFIFFLLLMLNFLN